MDECHRGSAKDESNWREILEYFEPASQLGMTATPLREDNRDTYRYFGNPLYTYSLRHFDGIQCIDPGGNQRVQDPPEIPVGVEQGLHIPPVKRFHNPRQPRHVHAVEPAWIEQRSGAVRKIVGEKHRVDSYDDSK